MGKGREDSAIFEEEMSWTEHIVTRLQHADRERFGDALLGLSGRSQDMMNRLFGEDDILFHISGRTFARLSFFGTNTSVVVSDDASLVCIIPKTLDHDQQKGHRIP